MISAGELKTPVTFSSVTTTLDPVYNSPVKVWETFCIRRAKLTTKSAREDLADDEITTEIVHVLEIRYDPQAKLINSDMRANFDGETYEIIAPPITTGINGRKEGLLIKCRLAL